MSPFCPSLFVTASDHEVDNARGFADELHAWPTDASPPVFGPTGHSQRATCQGYIRLRSSPTIDGEPGPRKPCFPKWTRFRSAVARCRIRWAVTKRRSWSVMIGDRIRHSGGSAGAVRSFSYEKAADTVT